jgi:SAM-dependent methyltransferase
MHEPVIPFLSCPNCHFSSFSLKKIHVQDDEILTGVLTCNHCTSWFKIDNGILDLLPRELRRDDLYEQFSLLHGLAFHAENRPVIDRQKDRQIQFFKDESSSFEENVVNSPYFRALNTLVFGRWLQSCTPVLHVPLLELGCGTGAQTLLIAHNKIRTVSTDISEEMITIARQKTGSAGLGNFVDFIVVDAENLPFMDDTFGGCVACATLHHTNNPENVVSGIAKKIKNQALVYTIDPHDSHIRFLFDLLMRLWPLYAEEAADNPLIHEKNLALWYKSAGMECTIRYSTFLPPHLFLPLSPGNALRLLEHSDKLSAIPFFSRFSGMIISEGIKSR